METRGSPEFQLRLVRDYQAGLRADAREVALRATRPKRHVGIVRARLGHALVVAGIAIAGASVTNANSVVRY